MTHEEAIAQIRQHRAALDSALHDADLQWRDKVSGLRGSFATQVSAILAALDGDEEPF